MGKPENIISRFRQAIVSTFLFSLQFFRRPLTSAFGGQRSAHRPQKSCAKARYSLRPDDSDLIPEEVRRTRMRESKSRQPIGFTAFILVAWVELSLRPSGYEFEARFPGQPKCSRQNAPTCRLRIDRRDRGSNSQPSAGPRSARRVPMAAMLYPANCRHFPVFALLPLPVSSMIRRDCHARAMT